MSQRTVHQSEIRDVLQTLIATRTQFSVVWTDDQNAIVSWQGATTQAPPVALKPRPTSPEGPAAA